MTKKDILRLEASQFLRKVIKPGDTIYTVLRHVSQSGMMRHIDIYVMSKNKYTGKYEPLYLSGYVADILDYRRANNGALRVGGCGMDMGFHVVYSLSSVLFKKGFKCIGERCGANDHFNAPHPERKAGSMVHHDGGYCLKQAWL